MMILNTVRFSIYKCSMKLKFKDYKRACNILSVKKILAYSLKHDNFFGLNFFTCYLINYSI